MNNALNPKLSFHFRTPALQLLGPIRPCDIPVGETRTYAQVAQSIGAPDAVRAVAGACAANVLAIAIPCHRVIRSDGSMSGYRWGVERKRARLERECGR